MQGYPDTLLWQHSFWLSISPQRNNQDGVVHTYTDIHGVTTAQAIFTQEQMDRVVDNLKVCTRKINAETKRFVSDSEWLSIDQVGKPPSVLCGDGDSFLFLCYGWLILSGGLCPLDHLPLVATCFCISSTFCKALVNEYRSRTKQQTRYIMSNEALPLKRFTVSINR